MGEVQQDDFQPLLRGIKAKNKGWFGKKDNRCIGLGGGKQQQPAYYGMGRKEY